MNKFEMFIPMVFIPLVYYTSAYNIKYCLQNTCLGLFIVKMTLVQILHLNFNDTTLLRGQQIIITYVMNYKLAHTQIACVAQKHCTLHWQLIIRRQSSCSPLRNILRPCPLQLSAPTPGVCFGHSSILTNLILPSRGHFHATRK